MKRNMLTGSYSRTSRINGILSSKMLLPDDSEARQKMVNEQDNDKERYPEERNTGVDVDAEEDGKCVTDYLCIHRSKRCA